MLKSQEYITLFSESIHTGKKYDMINAKEMKGEKNLKGSRVGRPQCHRARYSTHKTCRPEFHF
jgi:hypothetical protein